MKIISKIIFYSFIAYFIWDIYNCSKIEGEYYTESLLVPTTIILNSDLTGYYQYYDKSKGDFFVSKKLTWNIIAPESSINIEIEGEESQIYGLAAYRGSDLRFHFFGDIPCNRLLYNPKGHISPIVFKRKNSLAVLILDFFDNY